jgi:hypothetical protein
LKRLQSEIKRQGDLVATEKDRLAKSSLRYAPSAGARWAASAPAGGSLASRVERVVTQPEDSEIRPGLIAASIALSIAIAFLLLVGRTGATAEHRTARDPQPVPESASTATPEARPSLEYSQVAPVAPPTYTAVPLERELRLVPNVPTPDPPPETFREPVSLPNGTDLVPPQTSEGLGELKISNYTGGDAAVKLKTSPGRATVRFVYVRASSDATVAKIAPGEYFVQFATGQDWDANDLAFRRDRGFAAFDKALSFSERDVGDGTVYSIHEITLHAVPNGNVRKRAISAEEFYDDGGVSADRRPSK